MNCLHKETMSSCCSSGIDSDRMRCEACGEHANEVCLECDLELDA